mgnify:CR=1 FL=1
MRIGDLVELYKCQSFGGIDLYDVGIVIEVKPHKMSSHNTYMVHWTTANRTLAVSGWILRKVEPWTTT